MKIFLSSTKPSHGLKELLSPSLEKYWHTNNLLPHFIYLKFPILTYISTINLFLSFEKDDSYTPEDLIIFYNRKRIRKKLFEPEGMVKLKIGESVFDCVVVIRSNHQEGRDSHVRGIRVYGMDNVELYHNAD